MKSIYTRMLAVICTAIIPVFVGMSFYVYEQRNYMLDYTKRTALNYTDLTAHDESWLFHSTHQTLKAIASAPIVQEGNWTLCRQFLAGLLKNQTTYINLGVASLSGKALCEGVRNDTIISDNFADRGYFKDALAAGGPVVGQYQIGRLSLKPMIMVAMPLTNAHGEAIGVIYAALNLNAIMQGRHAGQLEPDTRLTILDRNGIVLNSVPPEPEAVGHEFADSGALALTRAYASHSEVLDYPDGSKWLVSHSRAGFGGDSYAVTVVHQQSLQSVLRDVNRSFWQSMLMALVLTLLAILIGWSGVQALVGRNVRSLTAAAKRFGQRKFDTRIGNSVSGAEFREIGRQFDAMAYELGKQELKWTASLQRQRDHSRILRMVAQNTALQDILTEIALFTEEQNEGVMAVITLLAHDGRRIEECIAPHMPQDYIAWLKDQPLDPGPGPGSRDLYENRIIVDHDLYSSPNWADHKDMAARYGLRSYWSHPILSPEERVLGTIALYSRAPRRPSQEELQFGQMAAGLTAVAAEHWRQRRALRFQSRHDPLTGLYNRNVVLGRIAKAIESARANESRAVIIIIDLDGFKEINDTLGHVLGDELLQQVSDRLRGISHFRADIARSGGNEFTLLLQNGASLEEVHDIVEATLGVIKQPYLLDGIQIQISASAGVASFPEAGADANALTRQAEHAMRRAKQEGRGYAFHDPAIEDVEPRRLLMLSHLRKALAENEFVLHFQPKVGLDHNQIIGFEALLRWNSPAHGLVAPGEFVPTLELTRTFR